MKQIYNCWNTNIIMSTHNTYLTPVYSSTRLYIINVNNVICFLNKRVSCKAISTIL